MNQRPSVPALLQLDDITPPCRRVLALVVVLDGIGKDVGLAYTPGANSKSSFSLNSPFIRCIFDISFLFDDAKIRKSGKILHSSLFILHFFL